jgi:N-acetylglucosaminyldiphosphoundecaprenol N-acetyl-beta-D-mannosaminyltransferase
MKILNINNLKPYMLDDVMDFCQRNIAKGKGAFLIPMNPIKVIKARKHPDFQNIVDRADWVFPDAWGIKWAASLLYGKEISIIPGYRLMLMLIEQAAGNGHSVYFLGTTNEALKIASERLIKEYKNLRIVGTHHGFFSDGEEMEIFQNIENLKPNYIFVAMGEYKQEKVVERLMRVYPSAIFMGVGGSVDLIAGKQPYPPAWIRNNHLEWLFRLFRQPFRAPRFRALPIFVFLIWLEKIKMLLKG